MARLHIWSIHTLYAFVLILFPTSMYAQQNSPLSESSSSLTQLERAMQQAHAQRKPKTEAEIAGKIAKIWEQRHQLAPLLHALKTRSEALRKIDYNNSSELFAELDKVSHYTWLSELDRAVLDLYMIECYDNYRLLHSWGNGYRHRGLTRELGAPVDSINPKEWTVQQYQDRYAQLWTRAWRKPKLLNTPATPYKELWETRILPQAHTLGQLVSATMWAHTKGWSWDSRQAQNFCEQYVRPSLVALAPYLIEQRDKLMNEILLSLLPQKGADNQEEILPSLISVLEKQGNSPLVLPYTNIVKYYALDTHREEAYHLLHSWERIASATKQEKQNLDQALNELCMTDWSATWEHDHIFSGIQTQSIILSSRLIDQVKVRLWRIDSPNPTDSLVNIARKTKPHAEFVHYLDATKRWTTHSDTIHLPSQEHGSYLIELLSQASPEARKSSVDTLLGHYIVTPTIGLELRDEHNGTLHLQLLDALSGKARSKTTVSLYSIDMHGRGMSKLHSTLQTDELGLLLIEKHSKNANRWLYVLEGAQGPYTYRTYGSSPRKFVPSTQQISLHLQTDRQIYRPGQVIHFSGIVSRLALSPEDSHTLAGRSIELTLFDRQHRVLRVDTLLSDAFGRFTQDYTIPSDGLLGDYNIWAEDLSSVKNTQDKDDDDYEENTSGQANIYISVEEYKRPLFALDLDEQQSGIQLGDTIKLSGSATEYNGSPVAGARVKYLISKSQESWGGTDYDESHWDSDQDEGTTITDSQGHFVILIPTHSLYSGKAGDKIYARCSYSCNLEVTHPTGETQQTATSYHFGSSPFVKLNIDLPAYLCKESKDNKFTISTQYTDQDKGIVKALCTLERNGKAYSSDTLELGQHSIPQSWLSLPSGRYILKYKPHSRLGSEDTIREHSLTIFSLQDSTVADAPTPLIYSPSQLYSEGNPPVVYYASTREGGNFFYELKTELGKTIRGVLHSRAGRLEHWEVPISEQGKIPEQIQLLIYLVQDGKLSKKEFTFDREHGDRSLSLRWTSFRNRLLAGNTEDWSLQVLYQGKPVQAAVSSWMYDASLDALTSSSDYSPKVIASRKRPTIGSTYLSEALPPYTEMHTPGMNDKYLSEAVLTYTGTRAIGASLSSPMNFALTGALHKSADDGISIAARRAQPEIQLPSLRQDFAETAYWLPRMQTDASGNVRWQFKLPENLTRWRVLVQAHTQDLRTGSLVELVESYRPLMVQPELPRFIREGDTVVCASQVRNLTQETQSGDLVVELLAPGSEQVLSRGTIHLILEAGASKVYTSPLVAPQGLDSVVLRARVITPTTSDGEQHILPIVPKTTTLIESYAFSLPAGQHQIDMGPLLASTEQAQDGVWHLSLEGNPLFYALTALPVLQKPESDNAVSLTSALYARAIASYIFASPEMKSKVRKWIEAQDSLVSPLLGRQAYNYKSLANTPWLQDAQRELQARRDLLPLLDDNSLGNYADNKWVERLGKLQTNTGDFSWYPDMPSNMYLTSHIMQQMVRWQRWAPIQKESPLAHIYTLGWSALDEHLTKAYQEYSKHKGKQEVYPYIALEYLYLQTLAKHTAKRETLEAIRYFEQQLSLKAYDLPIEDKAMAAIALSSSNPQLSRSLIESLREHLTTDSNGGLYYAQRPTRYWWTSRIYDALVLTLEAMVQVTPQDRESIQGLQRWLIGQKRGVEWQTTTATTDAIYALMLGQDIQQSTTASPMAVVALQDSSRVVLRGAHIAYELPITGGKRPASLSITVPQTSELWGSISVIHHSSIEVATATGAGAKVTRRLFVETAQGGERALQPIAVGDSLHIGDRLVTLLSFDLDQDLDFVVLSDARLGCVEPEITSSGYMWGAGTAYYYEPRDKETNFYFNRLIRGSYKLEYSTRVVRAGRYILPLAYLQSCYAPEFSAHTGYEGTQSVLPLKP